MRNDILIMQQTISSESLREGEHANTRTVVFNRSHATTRTPRDTLQNQKSSLHVK